MSEARDPGNLPPEPLMRLAESIRALTEAALRIHALPPALAAQVEAERARIDLLTAALDPHALNDAIPRMGPEPASQRPYYVRGVVMGPHHPLRPELEIFHRGGVTEGRVNFGVTFEGPPGCVHGGFVAHFFDQILGQHNLFAQIPAMTGTLSIHYRKGTPILRDLSFRVTHEASGDRKVITRGALRAGGELFSEGEGTFVVPRGSEWRDMSAPLRAR